ncbi:MAG: quinol:cytochrome C oxidoreductase [Cyclobacteriaceae bacterium]
MVAEEKNYEFKPEAKKKIAIVGAVGIVLFILGVFMAMNSGSGHGEEHASAQVLDNLVASTEQAAAGQEVVAEEHHGSPVWLKRVYTSLWQNNVFFAGLGIIGLFFVAIQYASQAGWSVPVKRIALAMGHWIPISGILMLVLWFIVKADVFHWTHHDLYVEGAGFDAIINGKSAYFFWPLEAGGFPLFYVLRLVVFFGLWYLFFIWIKKEMLAEDINGGTAHWTKARSLSAVFLVIFAVSSSIAAWDWVMSIDTHWFSTMMGWYVFASWWVTGLAFITVVAAYLKEAGYLKLLNANHFHDLGKFIFAFSIFWTYIWFSQFLLIYYANIPEETVYFVNQMNNSPYSWIFYTNIILNFVLPFLLLMTRDAKRHMSMLKVVCPIVIVGHWFDFYNMITPGVMQHDGAFGFVEIGLAMVFMAAFLFVTLSALSKAPLVAKNHPMMGETLNHHI